MNMLTAPSKLPSFLTAPAVIPVLICSLFLAAGCVETPAGPDHGTDVMPEWTTPSDPDQSMQSDCGNELPENCEEEETHNEL